MSSRDYLSTSENDYRRYLTKRSVGLRIDAIFESEDSEVRVAPTGKQCLIIGGTTVLELDN